MPEETGFNIALKRLGEGEVVLDLPPVDFYPPESSVESPHALETRNLRLLDNLATARPGYSRLGTSPNTDLVNGLYFALFDNGDSFLVRGTKVSLHSLASGTWTDRSGGATFTSLTDTNYWSFAMVRRLGAVSPQNEMFACDGLNLVKAWTGSGNFADIAGSPLGGRVVVPFLGRAFIMNHITTGNRHHSRVTRSVVGDPRTFVGIGSGTNDLDEDPFPVAAANVMHGGLVVLKGDENGGAIYRGTPTGVADEPVRYDAVNPGEGIGILLRRTFFLLTEGTAFFVAHDGFTLWDGIRGFKKIAQTSMRTILNSINPDALDAAHAWYKPRTQEIHIAIATGSSTVPTQTWVYNRRDDRLYGPYVYGDDITTSSPFIASSSIEWGGVGDGDGSMDFAGGWSTLPYASWGAIGGATGALVAALGTSGGHVQQDREEATDDDDGSPVNAFYDTGDIRLEGRLATGPGGEGIKFGPFDKINLREVTIEYTDNRSWMPVVQVSTDDGATYVTVSDGVTLSAGTGGLIVKTYVTNIEGNKFRVRVQGVTGGLHGLWFRCLPAGDSRNG